MSGGIHPRSCTGEVREMKPGVDEFAVKGELGRNVARHR
jgi:hypothetical protein